MWRNRQSARSLEANTAPRHTLPFLVHSSLAFLLALVNTVQFARCEDVPRKAISGDQVIEFLKSRHFTAVSFQHAKIVGPLDFSKALAGGRHDIDNQISITDSWFEGPFSGTGLSFGYPLQLTGNQFQQEVDLTRSTFHETVDLSHNVFQKSLDLDYAVFEAGLNLSGTTIGESSSNANLSFKWLVFDGSTEIEKLGLSRDRWMRYLGDMAKSGQTGFDYWQAAESIKFYPEKLPRDNALQYLARVIGTNIEENWIKRNLEVIFLDYTIGYGYKPYRLLYWVFSLTLAGLLVYQRRLNTERIGRERREKYPLWEERIDREFVGEPSVRLTFVPKRHRDYAMVEYRSRRKDLELMSREDSIALSNEAQISDFKAAWSAANVAITTKRSEDFTQATGQLTALLCDRLGFRRLEDASRYYEEKQAFKISAPTLRINVPSNLAFIFLQQRDHSVETVRTMIELVRMLGVESRYFGAALAFFSPERLRQAIRDSGPYRSDFIALDKKGVWEILAKTSPVRQFTQEILSQVDLLAVSPFELAGPVSDKMFYGRIEEEKTLTRSIAENNFAVVANRKIGKTSLLERVSRILSQDPDFRVLTFDLQRAEPNYNGFFRLLSAAPTSPTEPANPFGRHAGHLSDPKPMDFYEMTVSVRDEDPRRRLVLIFDEVDDLLFVDQSNKTQLFKTARALSQKNICRFIFVGSRILAQSLTNPDSPFFNFCTVLRLGCLDRTNAQRLITEPFREMGITIEEESRVVDRLLDVSAAHPNILQYACHQLLRRVNQKNTRTISLPDVEDTVEGEEFYQYFTGVVWGQADTYERLLIYLMIHSDKLTFKTEDIAAELDKRGISKRQLRGAVEVLSLYSLITRTNDEMSLTFRYLTEASRHRGNLEAIIEELTEDVRSKLG